MDHSLVRDSKRLSKALRHNPSIPHDAGGWFLIDDITRATGLTRDRISEIVTTNTRYGLSEDGEHIMAFHGHSIDVTFDGSVTPPDTLYHGTSQEGYGAIRDSGGILPMRRRYVHLSDSPEKAGVVGSRHGEPVILVIDAGRMHTDGHVFHRSVDGVYLTDRVPLTYVTEVVTAHRWLEVHDPSSQGYL